MWKYCGYSKFRYFVFYLLLFLTVLVAQPKKNYAVLTLKCGENITKGEAEIIADRLRIEIFNTGAANIMEREQMSAVLKEQGFQQSGVCADDGCMVELGQMLGVDRLVAGSIGTLGSVYLLNFRVINISTAKIEKVVSVDIKGSLENVVYKLKEIANDIVTTEQMSAKRIVVAEPSQKIENREPVVRQPSTVDGMKSYTSSDVDYDPPNTVFMLTVDYNNILSFVPKKDTKEEVDSDLRESLEDVLQDEIDDDITVVTITPEDIRNIPGSCKGGLVKPVMDSYRVEPDDDEYVGVATVTFYFYDTPFSTSPRFKVQVKDRGGSESREQDILEETFENLEDELAETLDGVKEIKYLSPYKK